MAKGQIWAFSNMKSPDREAEFNKWYNEVHFKEVCALDGFESGTRYRINQQLDPPAEQAAYQFVAVYECSDVPTALQSMADFGPKFTMTDAMDVPRSMVLTLEEVFTNKK